MWHQTRFTERLGVDYPIVQGPLGGGLSTTRLTATVSNAGGLGSFGANGLSPEQIIETTDEIRAETPRPFAINLWVSTEDDDANDVSETRFAQALTPLMPFYEELGVDAPATPHPTLTHFHEQVEAVLKAVPPVFSFVFGIPDQRIIEECRRRNIVTIGTATTVEEAVAIDQAGVDAIVATGIEAGGHRVSFLRDAESSLIGTFALVLRSSMRFKRR